MIGLIKNFSVHYRLLKFHVRQGMIVDKFHGIISFKQKKWLEKYTSFNTQNKIKAKNDFGKDFYKLPNNAFYGRCLEKVRISAILEFI